MLLYQKKQEQKRNDLAKYARLNALNKAEAVAKHKEKMSRQHQGINLHSQMGNTSSQDENFNKT